MSDAKRRCTCEPLPCGLERTPKENVARNLTDIVRAAAQLEERGISFSRVADSFLGVAESEQFNEWLRRRKASYDQLLTDSKPSFDEWLRSPEESRDPAPFRRVGFLFWVAADDEQQRG